jgi:hypothetical protein
VHTSADGGRISVQGDLTLVRKARPIAFDLTIGDGGTLSGSVVVKQTDWGITPYSALFGALKVADEVEVVIDAASRRADPGYVAEGAEAGVPAAAGSRPTRLRVPTVSPDVSSLLWALVFFGYLWFGMAAVGVSHGSALPLALVASVFILVFVRKRGGGGTGS